MIKIKELSKDELLSLIYNNMPRTLFDDHPVYCAACGGGYEGDLVSVHKTVVVPIAFVCDACEDGLT